MKQTILAQEPKTAEAFRLIGICLWVITRNTGMAINRLAHKYPWVFIVAILLISSVINAVLVGKARAERDGYNQQLSHVMMELHSAQDAIASE